MRWLPFGLVLAACLGALAFQRAEQPTTLPVGDANELPLSPRSLARRPVGLKPMPGLTIP
jgi:hypothetical protein